MMDRDSSWTPNDNDDDDDDDIAMIHFVIPGLRFSGKLTHHDARWTPIMMITMIIASEVDDDDDNDDDDDDALID